MGSKRHPQEIIDRMIELREVDGLSYDLIARRLNVSVGSVHWQLLKAGAERPGLTRRAIFNRGPLVAMRNGRPVRRFTEAEDEILLAMRKECALGVRIAERLGRSPNSIIGRLLTLARREERLERLHRRKAA